MFGNSEQLKMSLRKLQSEFAKHSLQLMQRMLDQGYEITYGHTLRCLRCPIGKANSLHKEKLAIDINLFKDGKYLTSTDAHRKFGAWWKKQHTAARWGGDFSDGNHYSFTYDNRA